MKLRELKFGRLIRRDSVERIIEENIDLFLEGGLVFRELGIIIKI